MMPSSAATTADPQSVLNSHLSNPAIDAGTRAELVAATRDLEWHQAQFTSRLASLLSTFISG